MDALRRSLSFQKHRRSESDSQVIDLNNAQREPSLERQRRASLDTLIIPHRTRYPSDQTRIAEPLAIDHYVAASLVTRTHSEPSILLNPFASTTTISKRQSSGNFVNNYNNIAKINGLSEISAFEEDGDDHLKLEKKHSNDTPTKTTKKTFFQRLSRKHSVSAISSRRPTPANGQAPSLSDICRLGGISSFTLPQSLAISHLFVPTAVAATGSHLVDYGRGTPGIFRIPGQSSIINALYDHFKSRLNTSEDSSDVETTIGSTNLPSDVLYNVHDVASTFKRFLWDLPGGILGSVSLFKALAEIQAKYEVRPCDDSAESRLSELLPDEVKPHVNSARSRGTELIALVLLSVKSEKRFALICAVFGLLAFLKQDVAEKDIQDFGPYILSPESMSSHALGVVFAPILLGNLTDQIEFHDGRKKPDTPTTQKTPLRGFLSAKKEKKLKSADCGPEIAASVSRANAAAAVVEILVQNWEGIIKHLSVLQVQASSRPASRSSVEQHLAGPRPRRSHDTHRHLHRPSVPSVGARRTISLTRSVSDTDLTGPARLSGQSFVQQQAATSEYGNIALPSRSASSSSSARNESRVPSSTRNISYSSSALQSINENTRWPSVHLPGDRYLIRSSGGSGESAPWWERSSGDDTPLTTPPLEKRTPHAPANTSFSRFTNSDAPEASSVKGSSFALHDGRHPAVQAGQAAANVSTPRQISDGSYYPADNASQASDSMIKRIVAPRSSLDSVLSPLSKTDRLPTARSSSRSLQNSMTKLNTDNSARTPATRSPQHLHPETALSAQARRSPMSESSHRTPRPARSPANVGHRLDGSSSTARSTGVATSEGWHKNPANYLRSQESYGTRFGGGQSTNMSQVHPAFRNEHSVQTYEPSFVENRPPHLLPFPDQPEVARRLNFRPAVERHRSVRESSNEYSSETSASGRSSLRPNIGTLYAEIGRLKNELDGRDDEIIHLKHQLHAMRAAKDSSTLSEKLRETERELRAWKSRAQWAEDTLFGKYGSKDRGGSLRRS